VTTMQKTIEKTLKALRKREFKAWYAATADEAQAIVLGMTPLDAVVGIGDSSTVRQLEIVEALKARGNSVINPFDISKVPWDKETLFEFLFWPSLAAMLCDVFLTGSNAVTEDGQIVNTDGVGNRVAGMFWGHQKVILVIGQNKITENVEEAIKRIKNVIAPEHIRRKGGSSPCTVTGHCHDCRGEKRVCAVTTVIEHKPLTTEINVVIAGEDLGLGWDKSWPVERIDAIASRHDPFVCPLPKVAGEKVDVNELWKMAKNKMKNRWILMNE
jgi:hypothetical protein